MSLSSVFQIAQNSLANMSKRTSVLSRNVNDAGNADYARRDLQTVTSLYGAQTLTVRRSADQQLEKATLSALSSSAGNNLLEQRLAALSGKLTVDGSGLVVSDKLTALHNSLQTLSSNPSNVALAQAAVSDANSLASSIAQAATDIQLARTTADQEIAGLVSELKSLLVEFEDANDAIKQGTKLGYDVNDAIDRRSALLKQISEIVPVSGYARANNDMVLTTTNGATLFETSARQIDFTAANTLSATVDGAPVFIDFVRFAVAGKQSGEASGKLDALLKMRDVILPGLQRQMDEVAHGLIASFAEQDSAATLAPLQGLFAWSGGPAFASEGVLIDGLAAAIFVNPLYDPQQGGLLSHLRDGGANGALYNANPSGASAFAGRITGLLASLDSGRPFAPAAGLSSQASVLDFARELGSVFAQTRSDANRNSGLAETKHARFAEQLSNETGVNIDNEMILLGELEHSYEASARLIRVADQMLQDLLAAVGR